MEFTDRARTRAQERLFDLVAGPDGPRTRDRVHGRRGPRWFPPGAPIRTVHGDVSMYVGGIRALLLQSLHPLAMAAVAEHSGFRGDPWGRLARTSAFLATTTFGAADDAERMIAAVRAVHGRVQGTTPDGRPYRADDPHLLRWVHVAEVDSFLSAHDRYGLDRLDPAAADEYVAQVAEVGERLGAGPGPLPRTRAELDAALTAFRPELEGTAASRAATRFILVHPPVPLAMRAPYGVLSSAAVGLLPRWTRPLLGLPWLPGTEATVGRASGYAAVGTLRWLMSPAPVNADESVGAAG